MISVIRSSISAINAFGKKMGIIADNVANVGSEGYKKKEAMFKENPNGGVSVEIRRVETPGHTVLVEENDSMVPKELSNVDLTEEIPQSVVTKRYYEVNLKILKSGEEMLGMLLDIKK